jgi:hypothetical protein
MKQPSGRPNKSGGRKFSPVPESATFREGIKGLNRVAFSGVIKSVKTAIDTVGDKVGTLIVTFRPEGKIVAHLDKLQVPDREVYVVILDKPGD